MANDHQPDTYLDFITKIPVCQEDVDFFSSMPFAQPYINSSSEYQAIPFLTRYANENTADTFFAKVINTADTVSRLLAMVRKTPPGQDEAKLQGADLPYFITFVHMGSDVNGYRDVVHGGILASLFDETVGLCAETYRAFVSKDRTRLYTATLDVSYRSPVATPGAVLIKTWVRQIEGRKWFLEAQLLDTDGLLKAEAKSLYIGARTHAAL